MESMHLGIFSRCVAWVRGVWKCFVIRFKICEKVLLFPFFFCLSQQIKLCSQLIRSDFVLFEQLLLNIVQWHRSMCLTLSMANGSMTNRSEIFCSSKNPHHKSVWFVNASIGLLSVQFHILLRAELKMESYGWQIGEFVCACLHVACINSWSQMHLSIDFTKTGNWKQVNNLFMNALLHRFAWAFGHGWVFLLSRDKIIHIYEFGNEI